MALKKQVFAELDKVARPDAILASNTSTLDIDEIASATGRPRQVIGHHFFSPANVMKLLEIVRGKHTSPEVIATSMDLAKRLGKVGVLVGNCRAFVGNRMFDPYIREAQFLVEEGAKVEEVDAALTAFGMAMGPLAVARPGRPGRGLAHPQGGRLRPAAGANGVPWPRTGCASWGTSARRPGPAGIATKAASARRRRTRTPRGSPRRRPAQAGIAAADDHARGDRRADGLRPRQRGGAHPGGRHRPAGRRHRHRLRLRLRLPAYRGGPMWYADTVGLKTGLRPHPPVRAAARGSLDPGPAADQAGQEGKTFAGFDRGKATG